MRVEVEPHRATVAPGRPTVLTVRVVNTGTVISGHRIRVLGVDPRWVQLDQQQLSLFPDAAGVAVLTITLPPGIPAGVRRLGVEVQELTPPAARRLVEVELTVPAELGLKIELDPVSTTGGRSTTVGVLVDNIGNSEVEIDLAGLDEEGHVRFVFRPVVTTLAPGERTMATAALRAKPPLAGSPKIRPFRVLVGPAQPPVAAYGTWIQKPLLTRGAIALVGLLAAVSVFAIVITLSLSRVVGHSNSDRDLALQVAQASQTGAGGGGGSGAMKGTVSLLTSGTGVSGVTVEIFNAANVAQPLASVATGASGAYQFAGLGVGTYKVRFSGAGFTQLWYPTSLSADNAVPLPLAAGQALVGIDARLGGVPASLTGVVVGADPTGATVTLEVATPGGAAAVVPPATGSATANSAIVTTQTLDASGAFTLAQIPSPNNYQLVVAKTGFSTVTQEVDLGSGEQRKGLVVTLRQGDGSIAGLVSTSEGPFGGATVSASDGHTTVSTVTLTEGTPGSFVLGNLPTPDTFTVTVTATSFATQTVTVALAAGQQLTGLAVSLATGVGSISGQAKLADGAPATGVTVTVTNGQLSVQTVTLSTGSAGTYQVSGLPVPSTYTVTFSRADLASQTKAVTLDALGNATATGVNATLTSATAVLSGTVLEKPPCDNQTANQCPVGQITVTLGSGSTSYQVTSASVKPIGAYEFDNVQPGTYTLSFTRPGGVPTSTILTLTAGQHRPFDPVLAPAASVSGFVFTASAVPEQATHLAGVEVRLFRADQFPSGQSRSTLTDANGHFSFENVDAPQSYVVQFAFPQGSPGQFTRGITTLGLSQQLVLCPDSPGDPAACEVTTG